MWETIVAVISGIVIGTRFKIGEQTRSNISAAYELSLLFLIFLLGLSIGKLGVALNEVVTNSAIFAFFTSLLSATFVQLLLRRETNV